MCHREQQRERSPSSISHGVQRDGCDSWRSIHHMPAVLAAEQCREKNLYSVTLARDFDILGQ